MKNVICDLKTAPKYPGKNRDLTNIECIAYTLLQVGAPADRFEMGTAARLREASLPPGVRPMWIFFVFLSNSVLFFRPKLL